MLTSAGQSPIQLDRLLPSAESREEGPDLASGFSEKCLNFKIFI